ncbi:MAG: T9SS type A sorting domain-containing protein [Bacteroidales bacterium]|nr:T9SS type A sorting domain-containing protein [Bacteroidales bacterium]
MKKLLLTLALMLSVFALSAQSFQVTERETGNVVESGATYYIFDDGSSYWGVGEELFLEFEVTAFGNVRLVAEKVENNTVENSRNYICFGLCYGSETYVTAPVDFNEYHPSDLYSMHYGAEIDHSYTEILGQELSMTYYLYEAATPDDKFVINIVFKYSLDGVDDNNSVDTFSNAYPVPARDVVNFDYNFASDVNAEIAVYNMMGQEVLRNAITGVSGKASVNVNNLADGVYFYSLIVNGKTEKSSKFVVKK